MYSLDEKLAALNDFHSGISRSEIMKKYNIKGSATISEWIRRMDQFGIDGLVYKHEKTITSRRQIIQESHSAIAV